MALAIVDTSAIIAYMVADDVLHASAVKAIETTMVGGSTLVMSVVTWSEALNGALLGHVPEAELREFVADFGIEIVDVDVNVAEQAAALQKAYRDTAKKAPRPKLRTPDALILATSLVYEDVTTIIGGDAKWANVPGITAEIKLLTE